MPSLGKVYKAAKNCLFGYVETDRSEYMLGEIGGCTGHGTRKPSLFKEVALCHKIKYLLIYKLIFFEEVFSIL